MDVPPPSSALKRCAQCGEPLPLQAAGAGCLHCLLDGLLEEAEAAPAPGAPSTMKLTRFHHYELLTGEDGQPLELGRGAMGVTYKAQDVNLHTPVALKLINPRYSTLPHARERFLREARTTARLRHPNVATVYHFGTVESDPETEDRPANGSGTETPAGTCCFYAMEFIEGETLEARLHRTGPLPPLQALEITLQITEALTAAEARGLVHRDLKPANIMLAGNGADLAQERRAGSDGARVKVIDFGLAKAIDATAGGTGDPPASSLPITHGGFVGTPQFASPEQFGGGEVDIRSDVYSLGVTLWYALTGRTPYEGDTPAEVHDRQIHRPLPVAQLTDLGTPPPVIDLLALMLAPDPARRPPSAAALRASLETCRAMIGGKASRAGRRLAAGVLALALAGVAALAVFFPWPHLRKFAPAPVKSVAVLPFENRSAQPDSEYFAAGVQDEILSLLARISGLKVISRHSVTRYEHAPANLSEVASQLGVDNVVEGSVQKIGDRARVNVQLIQTATGRQLWAESYDLQLDDLFAVESRVAHNVAEALAVQLTGPEQGRVSLQPTTDPAAYDAYLRGLPYISHPTFYTSDVLAAQRCFADAVRRDPGFALAWAHLSLVDSWGYESGWIDGTPALRDAAGFAAATALRLQPQLGEALLAMGYYRSACLHDDAGALDFYNRAVRVLPNSSALLRHRAEIAVHRGAWAEALQRYDDALHLDPRNVRTLAHRAALLCATRRFGECLHAYDEILRIIPGDPSTTSNKAGVLIATGDFDGAARLLDGLHPGPEDGDIVYNQVILDWMRRRPERAVARLTDLLTHRAEMKATSAAGWLAMLGRSQKLAGDPATGTTLHDARRELEILLATQPDNAFLTTDVARTRAAQGDHDAALAAARRAMELLPTATDRRMGPAMEDVLAEVAAQVGEPDLALATLTRLRHAEYEGALAGGPPVTGAILRFYPMFNALRGDPRFQALCRDD